MAFASTWPRACRAARTASRSPSPPILLDIEADPVLAGTKIIAEAWDAAGLYQVANFGGDRWAVWNGQYRDHVRRFVKSDAGTVGPLADNIVGEREPVSARRPPAEPQRQLHHRPRRLHAQRSRHLRRQAQRGQRRAEPRRHERQLQLELRRRGPDRRPGDRSAAPPADQEFFHDPAAVARAGRCC